MQPSPSWGDAPWQPITVGGLEKGEMPWERLSPRSHAGQQAPKPPTVVQRRGQTPKICFSQLAPLSSACWVQARLVGARGGRGLWLRSVCPCCWQCCDGCPPWRGQLLAPSPQDGGWRRLTLPDAFQKPFSLEKEEYFGGDDILAGRRQAEEKNRIKKTAVAIDKGSTRAAGLVLSPAALDFRTIWPGFLLQAAREGDEMPNVHVPCQSVSPHGTARSGESLSGWWMLVGTEA